MLKKPVWGLLGVVVFVLGLLSVAGTQATQSNPGTTMGVPFAECSVNGSGWYTPENAAGQPQVAAQAPASEFTPNNSSFWLGGSGSLECDSAELPDHFRTQPALSLSLAVRDKRSLAVESGDYLNLDQPATSAKALSQPRKLSQPNAFAGSAAPQDGLVRILVSKDNGDTYQPLHVLSATKLSNESNDGYLSLALPQELSTALDSLAVKVEGLRGDDSELVVLIDSLFISYEVAPNQKLSISSLDSRGQQLEPQAPVFDHKHGVKFRFGTHEEGQSFTRAVFSRARDAFRDPDQPAVEIEVALKDHTGQEVSDFTSSVGWAGKRFRSSGTWEIDIEPGAQITPGRHTATITVIDESGNTQSIEQDFLWGVLALNVHKSHYQGGETVAIDMAVLDELGDMVCDADLTLTIDGPSSTVLSTSDGSIQINEECQIKAWQVDVPDYETEWEIPKQLLGRHNGDYNLSLEAETANGVYTITDSFQVSDSEPFLVERETNTRIMPLFTYDVVFRITPTEDFSGTVTEQVPASFEISDYSKVKQVSNSGEPQSLNAQAELVASESSKQKLQWQVELKADQTYEFSYAYNAPLISPEFYLLGPLSLSSQGESVFSEPRQWQIASDSLGFPVVATTATSDTGNTATTTHAVSLPDDIAAGDLLLVNFVARDGPTVNFPSGWNLLASGTNDTLIGLLPIIRVATAWREADGNEGGSINVTTSSSARSAHTTYRITGARDPAIQPPEVSAIATGTSAEPDPPSLTPSGGATDYLWVALGGRQDSRGNVNQSPANYENHLNESGAGNANGVFAFSATRELNAASEDPGPFGSNRSEAWATFTVAVYPDVANLPPNTPSLDEPADEATDIISTPTLRTTATDPEEDNLQYRINLCTNADMSENCQVFDQTVSQAGWSGQNAAGGTAYTSGAQAAYTVDTELAEGTTYYWNSQAMDPDGSGFWSDLQASPYSFTTFIDESNTAPNSPSNLAQMKTDDTSLAVGDWSNEDAVKFTAQVSDPDDPDNLELCVEVKPLGVDFEDTQDSCGSAVAYSGSPVSASVSIESLAEDEYHWQARVRDEGGLYSSWVSFGGNPESERDFGVDTTAPTGGNVYDGDTPGVDITFNDGSLDELSGNWDDFNFDISGIDRYEYSLSTTQGEDDVVGWTDHGTNTIFTEEELELQTSQIYYVNVRAWDNAGNFALKSSDGQFIQPTLSFSVSPSELEFANLGSDNSYTDTQETIITTSTNAFGGYMVRTYAPAMLRTTDDTSSIGWFDGGTYNEPAAWGESTGYGYTSNDSSIQGSNKFGDGTLFAPFSTTTPGDIIADHTSPVIGQPIENQAFTITHRVSVEALQESGNYSTTVIYLVTAVY